MRAHVLVLGLSLCVVPAACADGSAASPATQTPAVTVAVGDAGSAAPPSSSGATLPCDVDALLAAHCRTCHTSPPSYGAPMPLLTYADLTAPSPSRPDKKVYEEALVRLTAGTMPPPPNAPPNAGELGTFASWAAAGAPPGKEACGPEAPAPEPKTLSCKPDTAVRPAHPWKVDAAKLDDYVCYGFDVTTQAKRHVIGLGPRVDNNRVVHHILLFRSDTAVSPEPTECSGTPSLEWQLYAQWAPGGDAIELPPAAGFPEEVGTTHWVVQIHYNNALALTGQVDETGYDLCTTDVLRPNDAGVMASGDFNFHIPPRVGDYERTCMYPWGAGLSGDYRAPHPDVKVFSVMPHMHKLGRSMNVYKLSPGYATRETIVEDPNFSFSSQSTTLVDVDVAKGDAIQTRCGWANPGDAPVSWGETTGDEMCFAFMGYYPAVSADPAWSWSIPSSSYATLCYDGE